MTETIRYNLVGQEDISWGTGTFDVTLADGSVVTLNQVSLSRILSSLGVTIEKGTILVGKSTGVIDTEVVGTDNDSLVADSSTTRGVTYRRVSVDPLEAGDVVWVAPGGSDTYDGKSAERAKLTVKAAYQALPSTGGRVNIIGSVFATDDPTVGLQIAGPSDAQYASLPAGWIQAKSGRVEFVGMGNVISQQYMIGPTARIRCTGGPILQITGLSQSPVFRRLTFSSAGETWVSGLNDHVVTISRGSAGTIASGTETALGRFESCVFGVANSASFKDAKAPILLGRDLLWFWFKDCAIQSVSTARQDDLHTPASTDTGADTVTFASAHGWTTGASWVIPHATGGGLTAGTVYYVRAVSTTEASFHLTAADAVANTNLVDLTSDVTTWLMDPDQDKYAGILLDNGGAGDGTGLVFLEDIRIAGGGGVRATLGQNTLYLTMTRIHGESNGASEPAQPIFESKASLV